MDGEITLDGRPGQNNAVSGGGAGGSVLVRTLHLRGYGSVHANGGRAFDNRYSSNPVLYSGKLKTVFQC